MTMWAFHDASFKEVDAHDGSGTVEAARVLDRGEVDGCRFVDLVILYPGATIGLHTHDDDEEIYVVIEGDGVMQVDDLRLPVGPGDVILNRPHGTHGMQNRGEGRIKLVVIDVGSPPAPSD